MKEVITCVIESKCTFDEIFTALEKVKKKYGDTISGALLIRAIEMELATL
jgi:hypothetical protein